MRVSCILPHPIYTLYISRDFARDISSLRSSHLTIFLSPLMALRSLSSSSRQIQHFSSKALRRGHRGVIVWLSCGQCGSKIEHLSIVPSLYHARFSVHIFCHADIGVSLFLHHLLHLFRIGFVNLKEQILTPMQRCDTAVEE